jgi:hypothetical protein
MKIIVNHQVAGPKIAAGIGSPTTTFEDKFVLALIGTLIGW